MLLFHPKIILHIYTGGRTTPTGKRYEISEDQSGNQLDISFEVETFAADGKDSAPNTARISVYNLSESTRRLLSGEHLALELFAGYGDSIGMIFAGETSNIVHEHETVDWRTDIYAGDGIKAWETCYFNKSYSAGVPVIKILQDMITATGLPAAIDIIPDDVLLKGETYSGRVSQCLNRLCKDRRIEWTIQHGTVEVSWKDDPFGRRDVEVVLINSNTGMIGHPLITERTDDEPKEEEQNKPKKGQKPTLKLGVTVQSLLNWQIKPNRPIKIEAASSTSLAGQLNKQRIYLNDASGIYVAKIVRHRGDNYGGEFLTEIEADL